MLLQSEGSLGRVGEIALTAPCVCPTCGAQLDTMPQRKTRCLHCRSFMWVRCTPGNRTRRLMTEAQKVQADQQWNEKAERELRVQEGSLYGLPYLPPDPQVRRGYNILKAERELKKLREHNCFGEVQLTAPRNAKCVACHRMDGMVLAVTCGAVDVVPSDCSRLLAGEAMCQIAVSPCIKRPDGTFYFSPVAAP